MDDQVREPHPDQPPQSRWFGLPRVSAADWDTVRESHIPVGKDIHGRRINHVASAWSSMV